MNNQRRNKALTQHEHSSRSAGTTRNGAIIVSGSHWVIALALGLCVSVLGCSVFKQSNEQIAASLEREVSKSDSPLIPKTRTESAAESKASVNRNGKPSSVTKVRLDGSLSLGDIDSLAFTSKTLATALNTTLEASQNASTASLVRHYPDIVSKILIEPRGELTAEHRQQVVDIYKRVWSTNATAFETLKASYKSGRTATVLENHGRFLAYLENNQPEEALKLRISRQAPDNELLQAEALRLEAMAYLMLEAHDDSVKRLESAVALLKEPQPLEANRIKLLLGETRRRNGQQDGWKSAWREAVIDQSQWVESKHLADPQFWKQAAFLRPISEPWPDIVVDRLRQFTSESGLDFGSGETDESVVWATIGLNSLRRHESQNAILSFKKAESTISNSALKKELQMQQAMAMISGGQAGPASAILLRLSSTNGLLADRSKAVLATLKLQNGSLAQGMSLLQSAIATSPQWPAEERLRAQADYGLAYLMRGKEAQGIKLLNEVYEGFLERNDHDQASQCLFNIAMYYEKTEKPQEQKATLARLESLESETY